MDVVYHKKGGTNDPAFLSKCVFRVDTSRGEEAPGAPVYFGNPVRLQLLRTRQFVTATNAPSKQAKRSFRLSLNKTRSKDCFLRLQPHLKIRSEVQFCSCACKILFRCHGRPVVIAMWNILNLYTPTTPHPPVRC